MKLRNTSDNLRDITFITRRRRIKIYDAESCQAVSRHSLKPKINLYCIFKNGFLTYCVSVTKSSQLKLFREIISVIWELRENINTLCEENAQVFYVKPGGTCKALIT
jgi:hypothetical protein